MRGRRRSWRRSESISPTCKCSQTLASPNNLPTASPRNTYHPIPPLPSGEDPSGMCDVPGLGGFCRESYNDPLALYGHLKRLGMDLVTVTDHDSIDAAEALRGKPDFFLSEEVSCVMPGGTRLHVGVYDLGERHHVELQRRRDDLPRFLSYLREQVLFFSVNHPLSRLTGQRKAEDFEWFEREFPAFEVLNGHMP